MAEGGVVVVVVGCLMDKDGSLVDSRFRLWCEFLVEEEVSKAEVATAGMGIGTSEKIEMGIGTAEM
jgi:hypothetical protein